MRRIRIMGLCLVAVFALTAVAVSSASAAAPEFYECHKVLIVGEGEWANSTCSIPGSGKTGKFKLQPGVGKGKVFKGTGEKAGLTTPELNSFIPCKSSKDEGKNTLFGQEKVKVTFVGCETLGKKCTTAEVVGGKFIKTIGTAGQIKTNPLEGELGIISPGKVGIHLKAEGGKPSAQFVCGTIGAGGLEVTTVGPIIGKLEGLTNTFSKVSTNIFNVVGTGKTAHQEVEKFEGGPVEVLETTIGKEGPFASGEETTTKNKGELLEIKV